jgi:hypothetical protein
LPWIAARVPIRYKPATMGENALEYGKSFSRQNRGRPTRRGRRAWRHSNARRRRRRARARGVERRERSRIRCVN